MARGDIVAVVLTQDDSYQIEEGRDGLLRFTGEYLTVDGIKSRRKIDGVPGNTLRSMISFPDGDAEDWHEVYPMGFSHQKYCEICWLKQGQLHRVITKPGVCKLVERENL